MNRNTKLIYKKWLLGLLIASNCNIVQPISFKETVRSSYFYRAFSFGYLSAITRISSLLSAVVVHSPFFLLRLFENRLSPESRLKIICFRFSNIQPDNSNWVKRYLQDIKSIETVDFGKDFIFSLRYWQYNPTVLELCADKLSPESRLEIICSPLFNIKPDNSNWVKLYLQDIKSIETVDYGMDFIRYLQYSSFNPIVLELCADKLSPESRLKIIKNYNISEIQESNSNWVVKRYLQDIKSIEHIKSKKLIVLYLLYGPNPIKLIQQRITPFLVPSLLYLSSDTIIHKRIDPQIKKYPETLINPILDKKKQFISECIDFWNNHWEKQNNLYYFLNEYEKQLVISNCLNL